MGNHHTQHRNPQTQHQTARQTETRTDPPPPADPDIEIEQAPAPDPEPENVPRVHASHLCPECGKPGRYITRTPGTTPGRVFIRRKCKNPGCGCTWRQPGRQ